MKARRSGQKKGPIEVVKEGSISIPIYATCNRVFLRDRATNERNVTAEYPQFAVTYYQGAKRVLKKFSTLADARTHADFVIKRLANGDTEALKLTGADSARYTDAMRTLRKWRPDAQLGLAVADYVAAASLLPEGVPLRECVSFWLKRHPQHQAKKTIAEVVTELIQSKRDAGKSDVYIKDLTCRLNSFAKDFRVPISTVSGRDIETWLRGLGLAPKTQNNHRRLIGTLFKFAIKRGYLPRDHDELTAVEVMDESGGEIEVFTTAELRTLFKFARPELQVYLAIAAFSGLRSAEIERLDWSEINLQERFIEVKAAKAKTASRRLAPIPDNLAAWLTPHFQKAGPVAPFANMAKQLLWLAEEITDAFKDEAVQAGRDASKIIFAWKHNGLRHSFISYRLAVVKDVAEVALEAGNSPQMVFKHYRALVPESQGKEWFQINPPTQENKVVQLNPPQRVEDAVCLVN
jgi:integrase